MIDIDKTLFFFCEEIEEKFANVYVGLLNEDLTPNIKTCVKIGDFISKDDVLKFVDTFIYKSKEKPKTENLKFLEYYKNINNIDFTENFKNKDKFNTKFKIKLNSDNSSDINLFYENFDNLFYEIDLTEDSNTVINDNIINIAVIDDKKEIFLFFDKYVIVVKLDIDKFKYYKSIDNIYIENILFQKGLFFGNGLIKENVFNSSVTINFINNTFFINDNNTLNKHIEIAKESVPNFLSKFEEENLYGNLCEFYYRLLANKLYDLEKNNDNWSDNVSFQKISNIVRIINKI